MGIKKYLKYLKYLRYIKRMKRFKNIKNIKYIKYIKLIYIKLMYKKYVKPLYINSKVTLNPLKYIILLFFSEMTLFFFVRLITDFVIEDRFFKKIILYIFFGLYFIFWSGYYIILKDKLMNLKSDSQKTSLVKFICKIFFKSVIIIYLWIMYNIEWGSINSLIRLICLLGYLIVFALMIKDLINYTFKSNIGMLNSILLVTFLFLGIYISGKSTLALPIITFGGYYLINWFASEDGMYYLSSQYGVRINSNIIKKHKLRWASKKADMLFVLISINIAFGIKTTIPINWKKFIVDKIVGALNNMKGPGYNDFLDREMIISLLVILTSIVIYVVIQKIIVKINRKESIVERNQTIKIKSKKPRINKR